MLLAVPLLLGTSYSLARAGGPDEGPGGGPGMWMGGGGEHGGPGGPRQRMERVLTAVGASDAQKAQVKTIWEALRPELKALRQEHEQVRKQIAEALSAPTIDAAHIEQLRKQSVQTMDKLSALMTSGFVQSAGVLTPDQRKKALETMKEHEGRHGGFRGHGPDAGPGPGPGAGQAR
jgi:Spy/CpxP family protein refolding chaperone